MVVGVLEKSHTEMTPSAFGVTPCCIADGTPTKKVGKGRVFAQKKTHPRHYFYADISATKHHAVCTRAFLRPRTHIPVDSDTIIIQNKKYYK